MLELNNINKIFDSGSFHEVQALDNVNLSISKGSFVVVVGTNGSGKSTLLNAIAGTIQIDRGRIILDKDDINRIPEHRRAGFIAHVFQNPFSGTASNLSISDNFAIASRRGLSRTLGRAGHSSFRSELRDRLSQLKLGLENRLETRIKNLSGGQRQALTLLMATWRLPKILLLDEHTAALDPKSADMVIQLTEEIISQNNLTTLMVTHSMQQGVAFGHRLIMMNKGKIIHDFQGAEKRRLHVNDLLNRFEDVRRMEQLDESAAQLLRRLYV